MPDDLETGRDTMDLVTGGAGFLLLLLNAGLSGIVAYVAYTKRRSAWAFFFLSFFLSFIVGIIVALAIAPGNQGRRGETNVECPFCREQINARAVVCKHCGKDVEPQLDVEEAAKVAIADTRRGTKLIVGIVLTVLGAILILPNLLTLAMGIGASILLFIGLIVGGALLAFGIVNIVQAVKSGRLAAK
jgi:hypothetical protein